MSYDTPTVKFSPDDYTGDDPRSDRARAIKWARRVLDTDKPVVILDTETTGLEKDAGIVQLGAIDRNGRTIIDTLVKCDRPERLLQKGRGGKCAADIHGIMPEHLEKAPDIEDLRWKTYNFKFLEGCVLVIYNLDYDLPLLTQMIKSGGRAMPAPAVVTCAMKNYSAYVGDWNEYHGNYRWQRLPQAANVKAHDALGDCISTLAVIRAMAVSEP